MWAALLAGLIFSVPGVYDGRGAEVDYIRITGSDITVQGYRVTGYGPGVNCIQVEGDRNTVRQNTVERCGATSIYVFSGAGHLVQDNGIRDPRRRGGWDSWGIYQHTATGLTVRGNEIYGSGFSTGPLAGTYVVSGNRILIPDDYRTSCDGKLRRDGPCQCGEFGIVLKGGGGGVVERNVIRGFRRADPICGGSGTPGAGIDLAAGGNLTYDVVIGQTVITDSTVGIYTGNPVRNIRIEANRLCRNGTAVSAGYGSVELLDNELFGNALNLYGTRTGAVSGNRQLVECPP